MITKNADEIWKPLKLKTHSASKRKYALSSKGRAASYTKDLHEDGKILFGSLTSGYRTLNLHLEDGNGTIYIHREVARLFCKKPTPKSNFVIHLNHVKDDNKIENLQWVNVKEMSDHQQKSPKKLAYKAKQANKVKGYKLTAAKVKQLKAAIANPNRKHTFKQIAEKFDISEMTLYRIKSGENWGHVE
jgi:hypothetical protein